MDKQSIRKALPIVILTVVAVTAIIVLKSQKSTVETRPAQPPPRINYGPLIQTHADQASRRNANALQSFELDVNRIIKQHEPKLQAAATAASKEAADYNSCCAIGTIGDRPRFLSYLIRIRILLENKNRGLSPIVPIVPLIK